MNTDDNDRLWELLGKTRQPSVSPFFSRNVLRAIRQESQEEDARRALFFPMALLGRLGRLTRALHRWTWQLAIAGTCVIAALITVAPAAFLRHHAEAPIQARLAPQIVGNPDYEVIKHLDELVADEESSLWLDDSVH
jgi:hypothetical protein